MKGCTCPDRLVDHRKMTVGHPYTACPYFGKITPLKLCESCGEKSDRRTWCANCHKLVCHVCFKQEYHIRIPPKRA